MKESRVRRSLQSLITSAQIPEDFLKGNVLVSIEGQEHVTIENFKGISSYTMQEIRLVTAMRKVCITGKDLRIDSYTKEEIEISGRIDKLEYL